MAIHKLSRSDIRDARKPTGDGGGLWLIADATGPRSWSFRFMFRGAAHEMGLGGVNDVAADSYSVEAARARAQEARQLLKDPTNPQSPGGQKRTGGCRAGSQGSRKDVRGTGG